MKNLTYIISNVDKVPQFEWTAIELNKGPYNFSFIMMNPRESDLELFLKENNIPVRRITYTGKRDIAKAIYESYRIFKEFKTQIVHAQSFDAGVAGLIGAKMASVKHRIYTRHHSDLHHTYHPSTVKYDKLVNKFSTRIIAVSEVVKKILVEREGVSKKRITVIPHGFKLEDFKNVSKESVDELKQKYFTSNHYPVIGMVSRYTEWKGIQYAISAFEKLLKDFPDGLLMLFNAKGDFAHSIKQQLSKLPAGSCREVEFEKNSPAMYKMFDVFLHVPVSQEVEAFGQVYIEAMAAGIPCVFTLSGIASEMVDNDQNAIVVPYKDSDAILEAMKRIIKDRKLADTLTKNASGDIEKKFDYKTMLAALDNFYQSL